MTSLKILSATLASAAALASLLAVSPARANCARPVGYQAVVNGNTVQVTPVNFDDRACPDADGMLRQAPATNEIVKLADYCAPTDELAAYVDECVPPGNYRYGFAKAYGCESAACGTSYFVEATVTAELDPSCTRSAGNAAPTAATSVPWKEDAIICQYGDDPDTGGDSGGCSMTAARGAGSVLLANALALLAGLALMRRRSASR